MKIEIREPEENIRRRAGGQKFQTKLEQSVDGKTPGTISVIVE